jgi:hypothetical protein
MGLYLLQLDRVRRYLERINRIYAGTYVAVDSADYYDDEVVSFFIHCYHIRDWILQLSKLPISSKQIDDFINQHEELKICADFSNGEKHCSLRRSTRTGRQPHLAFREYRVTHYSPESGVSSIRKAKYKILSGAKSFDVFELAKRCVELWEGFIAYQQQSYLNSKPTTKVGDED